MKDTATIQVGCSHFQKRMWVAAKAADMRLRCPKCTTPVVVAREPALEEELLGRARSQILRPWFPAGGILVILFVGLGLWLIASAKNQAEAASPIQVTGAPKKPSIPVPLGPKDAEITKPAPKSDEEPFDLKGDRLGMSLDEFKAKYTRKVQGHNQSAPFCSDTQPQKEIVTLLSKPWHTQAGIVNCSIAFPFEYIRGDAPTIAEVKTKLLVHHFLDGKLYRITVWFPHHGYTKGKGGLIAKHGAPKQQQTNEYQNRLGARFTGESLVWENTMSTIMLTERFGDLDTSSLIIEHGELAAIVQARTPKPTGGDL